MMLSQNSIRYNAPSDDPWMPAHREMTTRDGHKLWLPDYYLNLMGCIDQYQICNPNEPGTSACTKLAGQMSMLNKLTLNGTNAISLNEKQIPTVERIITNIGAMNIYYTVESRDASALNGE
jgi:hypothetical protein